MLVYFVHCLEYSYPKLMTKTTDTTQQKQWPKKQATNYDEKTNLVEKLSSLLTKTTLSGTKTLCSTEIR